MTITERTSNGYTWRYCNIGKNEFMAMSNEDKIYWLRQRKYITEIEGFRHQRYLKYVDDNTIIIQHDSTYKKFLFNLNTCEKTPITKEEYQTKYTNIKEYRIKAIEKQIAELQAKLEELKRG